MAYIATKLVYNILYRVSNKDLTTISTSDGNCKHTLMDIARSECFFPSQKQIHLADKINSSLTMFKSSKAEGLNYINEILRVDWQPMAPITYDCLLKLFNSSGY